MKAGILDVGEALVASHNYPDLLPVRTAYRPAFSAQWSMSTSLKYRWLDPRWFDQCILRNVTKIRPTELLNTAWFPKLGNSQKFQIVSILTTSSYFDELNEQNHESCLVWRKLCGVMTRLYKSDPNLQPVVGRLAINMVSRAPRDMFICACARLYTDGILTEELYREMMEWEFARGGLRAASLMGVEHLLTAQLPLWMLELFLNLRDALVGIELFQCLVERLPHLVASKLAMLTPSAIQFALQMDNDRLRTLGISRDLLDDYEQLKCQPTCRLKMLPWLEKRYNSQWLMHRIILRQSLAYVVRRYDWKMYAHHVKLEWFTEHQFVSTLLNTVRFNRDERVRICDMLLHILETPAVLEHGDPIPLIIKFHSQLPLQRIVQFITQAYYAFKHRKPAVMHTLDEVVKGARCQIPAFILDQLSSLYGLAEVSSRICIRWDGHSPLKLMQRRLRALGTPRSTIMCDSAWSFANGAGADIGGIGREFYARLGGEMRPYTEVLDGYHVPSDQFQLWGEIIRKIVNYDHQALEIDLHPIICVLLCWWNWIAGAEEPYPYCTIAELISRDWAIMLFPESMAAVIAACADSEKALMPCIEVVNEIRSRFNIMHYAEIVKSAGALTSITPYRLHKMIAGGSMLNVESLFAHLVTSTEFVERAGESRDVIVQKYVKTLRDCMVEMSMSRREDLYRYWFGTVRPDFEFQAPELTITAHAAFPCASARTCFSKLEIPRTIDGSASQSSAPILRSHIATCIERGLVNQEIAELNGILYQFK
jgi:hypothetical protein